MQSQRFIASGSERWSETAYYAALNATFEKGSCSLPRYHLLVFLWYESVRLTGWVTINEGSFSSAFLPAPQRNEGESGVFNPSWRLRQAGKYSSAPAAGAPQSVFWWWTHSLSCDESIFWITCFRFVESTWTGSKTNSFKFYFLWEGLGLFSSSKGKVEQLCRRPRKLVSFQITVVGDNFGEICP